MASNPLGQDHFLHAFSPPAFNFTVLVVHSHTAQRKGAHMAYWTTRGVMLGAAYTACASLVREAERWALCSLRFSGIRCLCPCLMGPGNVNTPQFLYFLSVVTAYPTELHLLGADPMEIFLLLTKASRWHPWGVVSVC